MTLKITKPGTAMGLDEIEAAEKRAANLRNALRALARANHRLELVRKHTKSGQVWRPRLTLHQDKNSYWNGRDVEIEVPISAGLIQQTVLNEYYAAKRAVILLGGDPRDAEKVS